MLKAVQLDPRYVPALLTYGVLLCQLDRFGTRFSCFTSTKAQILARKALLADAETCFTSTKAALLVQKYKYRRRRRYLLADAETCFNSTKN